MWRCSTRPDLAELLPFDADAGSSSNMVSSQPGRPLGLQSWSGEIKNTFVAAWRAPLKHPAQPIFGCASMAPLLVGQGSKEPARGGVLGVSSATSFFLEFPLILTTIGDPKKQKAKQKRLISAISFFSLVFKRRATGEKAPSSDHRESAKSAFFL